MKPKNNAIFAGIFSIIGFLAFLVDKNADSLILSVLLLMAAVIFMCFSRGFKGRFVLASLLSIIIAQGIVLVYLYSYYIPSQTNFTDYMEFYALLGSFVCIIFLFAYLYLKGDQINIKIKN